jgi:predicted tellurium resistance membrane protein TerC
MHPENLLAIGTRTAVEIAFGVAHVVFIAVVASVAVMLVAEGFGQHVSKGSTYFAMGFALAVEVVNYRADRHAKIAAERSRSQHQTS